MDILNQSIDDQLSTMDSISVPAITDTDIDKFTQSLTSINDNVMLANVALKANYYMDFTIIILLICLMLVTGLKDLFKR